MVGDERVDLLGSYEAAFGSLHSTPSFMVAGVTASACRDQPRSRLPFTFVFAKAAWEAFAISSASEML